MEGEKLRCSGDCLKCSPAQRQYCSAQMTYDLTRSMEAMQGAVARLEERVAALQVGESELFRPTTEEKV